MKIDPAKRIPPGPLDGVAFSNADRDKARHLAQALEGIALPYLSVLHVALSRYVAHLDDVAMYLATEIYSGEPTEHRKTTQRALILIQAMMQAEAHRFEAGTGELFTDEDE